MRDFPIFTTDFGVSSLVLREIPYRKEAYIHIGDVQPGMMEDHLEECVSFCRMAGAERIYGTGMGLENYPVSTSVFEMRAPVHTEPEQLACLFPVTRETVNQWREIYNKAMRQVPTARTLEKRDEQKILESGGTYFVHEAGSLLGIGWVEDGKLLAVCAVQRGAGERVMKTLMSLLEEGDLVLEVASGNERAIRLYERLGFVKTRLVTQWHDLSGWKKCETI